MHHWRMLILAGLWAAAASHAAVVYKWTDADGVVHFSDQAIPGAEKIVTATGSLNRLETPSTARSPPPNAQATDAELPGLEYRRFSVASPAAEQVFFGDDVVAVRLELDPALKPNQTVAWFLNGQLLDDQGPTTVAFALNLPRGAYMLAATLTDSATGESRTSNSVTFYVREPSELSPQHKRS